MSGGVHFDDAVTPDGMRIYAIGDVHGRYDLLTRMHAVIAEEISRNAPADWRIVHLGDYVDRGPQSREVIDFLSRTVRSEPRAIALRGNHDEGFLQFLADPAKADLFINYGGFDTAASYGVVLEVATPTALEESHRRLLAAMPVDHLTFLRDLPSSAEFGDFFFCHAGIRPGVPLDRQEQHDLVWIRREFLDDGRLHPKVVVHGHTPCPQADIRANRVNIDTMAFSSGRLTALVAEGRKKRFLTAEA